MMTLAGCSFEKEMSHNSHSDGRPVVYMYSRLTAVDAFVCDCSISS